MQVDVARVVGAVTREVRRMERDGKPAQAVVASRDYDTGIEDLWDALTNQERIPRWFTNVSGDLQPGGRYQIQGNASGTITECQPPVSFALTWEFSGKVSWVIVKLTSIDDDHTHLELQHIASVDPDWERQYGPGAVGVGWDLSLLGLELHLTTGEPKPPEADGEWLQSANYKTFVQESADGWRDAAVAAGAPADEANAAGANTAGFYKGEPQG